MQIQWLLVSKRLHCKTQPPQSLLILFVNIILPSQIPIIQIIPYITIMVFKGAVEERDRDGKRSQALYAFPPEASITEFLGYLQNRCCGDLIKIHYIQVAGTDLPRSLQEKLENERNIVISIWRLSPRYHYPPGSPCNTMCIDSSYVEMKYKLYISNLMFFSAARSRSTQWLWTTETPLSRWFMSKLSSRMQFDMIWNEGDPGGNLQVNQEWRQLQCWGDEEESGQGVPRSVSTEGDFASDHQANDQYLEHWHGDQYPSFSLLVFQNS